MEPGRTVPFLHVVLPYWGDPDLLDRAVDSVLGQSDPDWRLTIVDDHYPDLRAQETYADHPDSRIDYLRNSENIGLTRNFERCRTVADGELVTFLGGDDLLLPTYVAELRSTRARHPHATIFQPGVRVIDSTGEPSFGLGERVKAWLAPSGPRPVVLSGEDLATSLMRGNWLYWPSLAIAGAAVDRHSFRTDLPIILDLAFIMDMVLDGAELVVLDAVTFCYRRHDDSASSVSSLQGRRFDDEKLFYREMVERLSACGWHRAAGVARRRVVSRLHELSLFPGILRRRLRHRNG
ncbi:glycosyltransferase family 2 protein [Nocardioides xinjiangensis]|uniref:glycosyltransferase family 2 protein n=1 Tax=Nocardioides xinjiangensis TaxID=2817376 RepID=UPI001B3155DD|nr:MULTISPECIES: glycosyltransferase [unclassified Nocardioides]